jgi:hypothetical protein
MYQNMLDEMSGVRGRYSVMTESADDWIIIGKRSLTGVHIWHQYKHDAVELAFDGPRRNIVGGKVPPGSEDRSEGNVSYRQYRWNVDPVDVRKPPFDQAGVKQAIERAIWAFDWVRQNRPI